MDHCTTIKFQPSIPQLALDSALASVLHHHNRRRGGRWVHSLAAVAESKRGNSPSVFPYQPAKENGDKRSAVWSAHCAGVG